MKHILKLSFLLIVSLVFTSGILSQTQKIEAVIGYVSKNMEISGTQIVTCSITNNSASEVSSALLSIVLKNAKNFQVATGWSSDWTLLPGLSSEFDIIITAPDKKGSYPVRVYVYYDEKMLTSKKLQIKVK